MSDKKCAPHMIFSSLSFFVFQVIDKSLYVAEFHQDERQEQE